MIATLFFDLDGTLTDSAPGIVRCIEHALRAHGLASVPEARLRACVGPPLAESFLELTGEERLVDSLIAAYRERFVEKGMFENRVYDGVEAMLDACLAAGVALHVVTAKPAPYAERVLSHFGLRDRFGTVHGPALGGPLAPKRALVEAAVTQLRIAPEETAMIGDRGIDMQAARDNGVRAWGVRWGYGSDDELLAAGAGVLLDAPDDVLDCWRAPRD